ncbi:MAG: chemotaxis protein CheA [Desulfobacterales bacterium]|nr:chemotaxis protein CheA [Desulfobacterales bacterium]MBF0396657.1 chemotaxis protein CheA [Desulfobacterales bacterium]
MSQWDEQDIELFRKDAEQLLLNVQENILKIEKDSSDKEAVNNIFRGMHTIKGASAMFGFNEISEFSHRVENILSHVRDSKISITPELINLLLSARDQIHLMFQETESGVKSDIELREMIIEAFETLLPAANECPAPEAITKKDHIVNYQIHLNVNSEVSPSDHYLVLLVLLNKLSRLGECQLVPYSEGWSIIIATSYDIRVIKEAFDFVQGISLVKIEELKDDFQKEPDDMIPRIGEILSKFHYITQEDVDTALSRQKQINKLIGGMISPSKLNLLMSQQKSESNVKADHSTSSEKLDKLINLVGELVFIQSQITHATDMSNSIELSAPIRQLELLTSELRDCVLSIRMSPFGTIFSQFQRLVRDLSSELCKEIELVTEGADVELYKTDIDRLIKPLIHMIRNSIDHGIESPEERQKANKPAKGTIRLAAANKSANIVITVEDDGAGLDVDAIKAKAIEKGLISPDAKLSEKEIFSQIFVPGFSTSEKVTSVSGRGVGMDVVRQCITELSGTIEISSQKGVKTVFSIQLPLPLAIIDGLLVRTGESDFVIPLDTVVECLELNKYNMTTSDKRNIIIVRDEMIPFVCLKDIFFINSSYTDNESIVIVQIDGTKIGIAVDEIIGDHKAVIKPLGDFFHDTKGIAGATILGNGTMALIIDVLQLIYLAKEEEKKGIV